MVLEDGSLKERYLWSAIKRRRYARREHPYQVAVLLGADPYVAIAPFAQLAKLLDLGVVVLRVVLDWKSRGVIHADVASKSEENARGFIGQKLGK